MNKGSQEDIQSAVGWTIERVARESYGRLVAYLSVHTHDLASAEDALSNALVSALNHWPQDGVHGKIRSEEHTSELQSRLHLVCRLLLEKKKKATMAMIRV